MVVRRYIKVACTVGFLVMGLLANERLSGILNAAILTPIKSGSAATPKPTPRRKTYREFPHDAKAHRVECGTCHKFPSTNWNKVRTGTDAIPDITEYPNHESCLKCHTPQFFKGATPNICSICHINPSPRNSTRHPFPNPREIFDLSPKGKKAQSDFVVGFPHDKHIEIVSANTNPKGAFVNASFSRDPGRRGEASCAVCHQTLLPQAEGADEFVTKPPATLGEGFWLKKGTFKTAPIGHTTCFSCHSQDSGMLPAPNNCSACHQYKPALPKADFDEKIAEAMKIDDKRMLNSWRLRDSSGKYQHAFMAHVDMECATCHNVQKMNTADFATKRVSIEACTMCHVTATSDEGGALNFEVDSRKKNPAFECVKCHITFGKSPIPESHTKAILAAGGK